MITEDIRRLIAGGYESRSVEFKGAGSWDDPALQAALKKACLAMGNTRDGGTVVVGVRALSATPGLHELEPLSTEQLNSFDPDTVIPQINAHVSPHLSVEVERHEIEASRWVIAIRVSELRDLPFLCVKDIAGAGGRVVVPRGRILVRSRRAHESTDVQHPEDLRELMDLVVDKGLEEYFRRRAIEGDAATSDTQLFDSELGGL
jgi:predicted HTH transcriptional regulator